MNHELADIIIKQGRILKWVAKKVGVSIPTIYSWGENKSLITVKCHTKLIEILGEDYIKWYNRK